MKQQSSMKFTTGLLAVIFLAVFAPMMSGADGHPDPLISAAEFMQVDPRISGIKPVGSLPAPLPPPLAALLHTPARVLDRQEHALPYIFSRTLHGPAGAFDVLAVFNWDSASPLTVTIPAAYTGYRSESAPIVYNFSDETLIAGRELNILLRLAPRSARLFTIQAPLGRPQLIGTTVHPLQQAWFLKDETWDDVSHVLAGVVQLPTGQALTLIWYTPQYFNYTSFTCSDPVARLHIAHDHTIRLHLSPTATQTVHFRLFFDYAG